MNLFTPVLGAIFTIQFWQFVAVTAGVYSIFALGLQLQFGFGGLLNFGHIGFMAIGSYTMAILIVHATMPMWLAALIAIATAMLFGLIVGLPALRLRADYLAITTIAFSEIIRIFILNSVRWTGGPIGLLGFTSDYEGFRNSLERRFAWLDPDRVLLVLIWPTVLLLYLLLRRLTRSPWGRVLRAIREDEDAANALGKNPLAYKLQALAIGSGIAAIAGIFFAYQFLYINPENFEPLLTFFAWVIVLLGGTARLGGVPVGAAIFAVIFAGTRFLGFWPLSLLDDGDRASVRLIVVGLILIGLMAFRPQGIFGKKEELLLDR
jgi:ABC-type branched-subunit amino acid transport system permease subunit